MANLLISLLSVLLYGVASVRLLAALGRARPVALSESLDGAQTSADNTAAAPDLYTLQHKRRVTFLIVALALVLHAWVVFAQTGLPSVLRLPLLTSLTLTAFCVVLLQLVLCLRQPADYLGLLLYPLAAITLLFSHTADNGAPIVSGAVEIHVLLSVLAYALLSLAAAQAALVAVQRHYLSHHRPGGFIRALPPFDTTEQLLFTLLKAGFVMLTLSLASGFFYLEDMFAQTLLHKTVLSCTAWLIFGVLLFGRWRFGWRGKRVVHWTLAGFAVLIVAYFGSKLVLEIILSR